MQNETDALIIGAIISLLASLLTFILTSFYKWKDDERKRQWQQADTKMQRRLDVINKRVSEIRIFVDQFLSLQNKYISAQDTIINFSYQEKSNEVMKIVEEINILKVEIEKKMVAVLSLGDDELTDLCIKASEMLTTGYNNLAELALKKEGNKAINANEEKVRIEAFKFEGALLGAKITKRIDELSGLN